MAIIRRASALAAAAPPPHAPASADAGPYSHAALVRRAGQWLRNSAGCRFVLTEPKCSFISEQPDAIGWKGLDSYMVEVKVSRGDFLADRRKASSRMGRRTGAHRFYLTPPGLLRPEEIPEPWGLLEFDATAVRGRGRVRQVVRGLAALRPKLGYPERNMEAEIAILLSAAQGVSETMIRHFRAEALGEEPK